MATTQLQLRKGNVTQHNVFTGANAEVTVVTDGSGNALSLRLHDGTTAGGIPVAGDGQVTTAASFGALIGAELSPYTVAVTQAYFAGGNGKGAGVYIKTTATGTPGDTNYGSYFYDADGFKWVLQHNGTVSIDQFGFVADYNTTTKTGTDNGVKMLAIAADETINKVLGVKGKYYMGVLTNSTSSVGYGHKGQFYRSIDIDWQGAELFIRLADENAANITSTFIVFFESYSSMRNYEFTHIDWDRTKASVGNRGVFPVVISSPISATKDVHGFEFENVLVHRGQGLFTASSGKITNGYNYQASGITLKGYCHGEEVYYGIALFHSGNKTKGKYSVHNFIRSYISYDASDVDLEIIATGDNQATSASLLPYATGDRPSKNLKIRGTYAMINGPISPTAEHEAGSAAVLDNWDIDVYVDTLGDNMNSINSIPFRLGSVQVSDSVYQETGTYGVKQNCRFRIRTGRSVIVNNYFYLQTTSPNLKPFFVDARNFDVSSVKHQRMPFYTPNGLQIGHRGDLQADPLTFSLKDVLDKDVSPGGLFAGGSALFTYSGVPANNVFKKFWMRGSLNSDGTEVVSIYQEYESFLAGTYNPTVTFSTDPLGSAAVTVQASAGGDVNGRHVFTLANLTGGSINL
jgi:hypothetical protein